MDNMPVVPVLMPGTCTCPHMSHVRQFFFFLAQRNVHLLLAHVPCCRDADADMLSRLQVEGFRSRACGTLPVPTMVPSRVGSGFNMTTSPAGELRGCLHITGLQVRAESVPDFLSGGGDPSPVPPPRVRAGSVCGPPGYAPFRGHPPHIRGRAAAFQLPFRLPDEGGGYAFSRVVLHGLQCSQADRFMQLPGQPISTTLILPRVYIRRHFPARDAIMLLAVVFSALWPAALCRILLPLSALL